MAFVFNAANGEAEAADDADDVVVPAATWPCKRSYDSDSDEDDHAEDCDVESVNCCCCC